MDVICSCSYNGALQRAENHSAVYHQIYCAPLPQTDAVAMCYGTPQSAPRLQSSLPVPHQRCCPAIRLLHTCAPSESVHLAHTALFVLLKGRGKTLHCFFSICLFVCMAQEIKEDLLKVNDFVPMREKTPLCKLQVPSYSFAFQLDISAFKRSNHSNYLQVTLGF